MKCYIKAIGWIIGLLDYWIIGLLDFWMVGMLGGWIVGGLDGWMVGWLENRKEKIEKRRDGKKILVFVLYSFSAAVFVL